MLGTADSSWAADQLASQFTKIRQPQLDVTEVLGEVTDYQIRVRPVGGIFRVERWERDALMWEAEDEADVPF